MPLRSRLAMLVATAVAVAVAASAIACWLLTRTQLRSELDNTLRRTNVPPSYVQSLLTECHPDETKLDNAQPSSVYGQVVGVNGGRCVASGSRGVKVQRQDVAVADGAKTQAMHDGVTDHGEAVRVFTQRIVIRGIAGGPAGEAAISISRPLDEINTTLNRLALFLLAVAGIGVVGAGAAGLWVARTGLKPVDKLTGAVEHVARTEDLTVRIPVEGEDEIARLSRSFNAMTAALASSRDRQAQLIADAGHELRTPLTSLRTNIELLARSDETGRAIPPADRKALMASVTAQMSELASLIGDLQELSRPDAVREGPLEVVGLHDITRVALDRARLRGPELTITAQLAPWYVRAEPAALQRAVVNVLDNAVKFSPPRGTITVALDRGVLTVRDQGPGIPAEDLPHVFERFWRSPSARALPGSGLGLSIVARTVRHAGGEVTLTAPPSGGTLATITLPGAPTPPPETP
ncbi:sensor histidine kinase [Streptomyces violascens]|uniref:sensor histidine kinase n=1 Tax=Streptomyces violascens TaxID=67381 RepID=UPI00379D6019